ncbi:hypothetical protein D6851_15900 [Altericroceibacterium spongiae]|uniref:Uncharacterized protein n=1 Tax=Altericroceibacterium spongiae TaxID=2320269 RepID=A0A420EAP6_9SPHN|nr:hypothetical protein [Altericroceibacterium spongiae]RKF17740.1 hypothetical protein D6851_15900 [Altericroceibacterium spongiae]
MANYDFQKARKPNPDSASDDSRTMDFSSLPKNPVSISDAEEKHAVQRGDDLGFISRGQGTTRRRKPAKRQKSLYVKGPEEIIDWFVEYTNTQNHSAYWKSIEDLKNMIEGQGK